MRKIILVAMIAAIIVPCLSSCVVYSSCDPYATTSCRERVYYSPGQLPYNAHVETRGGDPRSTQCAISSGLGGY